MSPADSDDGCASDPRARLVLFPLTTLCLLVCIYAAYRHDGRRSPLVLALGAWAFSLALASPVLFRYTVDYTIKADALAAASLVAATIGYRLCRRSSRPAPPTSYGRLREVRVAQTLGSVGLLGCMLMLLDARANSGLQFNLGYLLENLSTIRADSRDKLAFGNSRDLAGTLGALIAPASFLCVIAAVRLGRTGGSALRALAIVNFVLVLAVSLMIFAGRATITNLLLLGLASLYLSGRRLTPFRPGTLIASLLLVSGVWYFSTGLLGTREKNANAIAYLAETRAEVSPWLGDIADRDPSIGLAMVSVGYFASPLPTLAFYMQQPMPGPYYGAYSYPLPARFFGAREWYATRLEIYAPIEAQNYYGNVWATWLRDLLVDFGYIGAIAFSLLFGAFVAWARNGHEATGALHYHLLEVIACFTLGFGAFTNFLWEPFIAYSFYFALAVAVFMYMTTRPAGAPVRLTRA